MKYFLTVLLLCFCLSGLVAQEKHFVFIQSDNNLPFYVSVNGKLHSSSASGYVIIPKLTDDNYKVSIGFAKNAFPEQGFEIVVENKDLGFNLKNFGEKGWGLFNLQSLAVTMAGSNRPDDVARAINEKTAKKDDYEPLISFDKKKKPAAAETKKPEDTLVSEPGAATDQAKTSIDKSKIENTTEAKAGDIAATDVQKLSETKDDDGVHLSYTEDGNKKGDTIHISIPSDKDSNSESVGAASEKTSTNASETASADANAAAASKPAETETSPAAKDDVKFLDITTDKSKKDAEPAKSNTVITNSKCKNIASDEDYARLRKKMAMETTDEKMINEAKKMYRNRCFTTEQIKKLSTLFLSDGARYNFFSASYNSVADTSDYSTLQSEFIDPAFVNRFKAMLQ